MDPNAALCHQWKQRENKLYSHKAEVHIEEMKEVVSRPTIDPLSRKVAEIVTRREVEMLGIPVNETPQRKSLYQIPKFSPQPKPENKQSVDLTDSPLNQMDPVAYSVSNPRSTVENKAGMNSGLSSEGGHQADIASLLNSNTQSNDLSKPTEKLDLIEDKSQKHEEMMTNLEHVEAFREELHREYPELGLNNSMEGSSFHTNELKELEDLCLGNNEARPSNQGDTMKEMADDNKLVSSDLINKGNHDILIVNDEDSIHPTSKINPTADASSVIKPIAAFKVVEIKDKHLNQEPTSLHSRMYSTSSLPDLHSQNFVNLQNSYTKATFIHASQDLIPSTVPRCHVNLASQRASPIYFSARVSKNSRVQSTNGIALADSLRRQLLEPEVKVKEEGSKDFYSKNMEWCMRKSEKTIKLRQSIEDNEIKSCTFDPFKWKKTGAKQCKTARRSNECKKVTPVKTQKKKKAKRPEKLIAYSALSPALARVGFKEGCAVEKLIEKSKLMINYRSISFC